MRRTVISFVCLFLGLCSQALADQPAPNVISTRQTHFSIPFTVSRAEQESQKAVEVQLYVSIDQGKSWRLFHKVPPEYGHFLFRSNVDGHYWFAVRTLDQSGKLRPCGPCRPGLCVNIDTTPPSLELSAVQGGAGEITVNWKSNELNPKNDSLKIQYRIGPTGQWQSVAIDHNSVKAFAPIQTGTVTWWSQANSGRLEVRAETYDLAGNPAVTHTQIDLGQTRPTTIGATSIPIPAQPAQWRPDSTDPTIIDNRYRPSAVAAPPNPAIGNRYSPTNNQGPNTSKPPNGVSIRPASEMSTSFSGSTPAPKRYHFR